MIKYLVLGASILFFIAGGLFFWAGRQNVMYPQAGSYQIPTTTSTQPTLAPGVNPAATTSATSSMSAGGHYTIHANDEGADVTRIFVTIGSTLQLTFVVNATGTSPAGLDFRSPIASTGAISPGNSKTITFVANGGVNFIPYQPSTDIQKPYKITVLAAQGGEQ